MEDEQFHDAHDGSTKPESTIKDLTEYDEQKEKEEESKSENGEEKVVLAEDAPKFYDVRESNSRLNDFRLSKLEN